MNSIEIPFIRRPFLQPFLPNLLILLTIALKTLETELSGRFNLER